MKPWHLKFVPNQLKYNQKKYNDFVNTFYKCFTEKDIKRVENSQILSNFMTSVLKGPASFALAIFTPLQVLPLIQTSFSDIGIAYQIMLFGSCYAFYRVSLSQLMQLNQFRFQKKLYYKYKEEIEELQKAEPIQIEPPEKVEQIE